MSKTGLNTDIDNTQTRCPLVVLIDDSSSMSGDPIRQVHDGIELLVQSLQEDDVAAYAVELCITSLNSGIIQEFTPIYDINLQKLKDKLPEADDCTPLGTGIKNSIELLDKLVELYDRHGIAKYTPHIIIMSDGEPDSDEYHMCVEYGDEIRQREEQNKIVSLSLAVDGADKDIMNQFSVNGCINIDSAKFINFFQFVSRSMSAMSRSGLTASVQKEDIADWANL